jgi:hypothetical protein
MGTPREPKAAKYFVAVLSSDTELLTSVENDLTSALSEIDSRSDVTPWTASNFYQKEMGPRLLRCFLSLRDLESPERLAAVKLKTQEIEDRYRSPQTHGRSVNLDPGYIDALKVGLASTKNAGQRIYLHLGIYGEVTLRFYNAGFHGLDYTYSDYLWPASIEFFTQLRARYLIQLKQVV